VFRKPSYELQGTRDAAVAVAVAVKCYF
jgi:hypothetical protein